MQFLSLLNTAQTRYGFPGLFKKILDRIFRTASNRTKPFVIIRVRSEKNGFGMKPQTGEITHLLHRVARGDQSALEELIRLVNQDLRRIAAAQMRHEGTDHILQPTALVNEFYLRLVKQRRIDLKDRSAFFGVAAKIMRRVLIEYARAHSAKKRGGDQERVLLEEAVLFKEGQPEEILAVDEALTRLEKSDPLQGRIVELRFFGGMTVNETAEFLGITPAAVEKEWNFAKAWLHHELKTGHGNTVRRTRKS